MRICQKSLFQDSDVLWKGHNTLKHLPRDTKDLFRGLELNKIQRFFDTERLNTLMQCEYNSLQNSLRKTEFEKFDS